jgi:hypothetical protein
MNKDTKLDLKKRTPYWAAMLIGIITTIVVSYLLTINFINGAFTFWKSLDSPPSGASHIIDADPDNIWIEANDGHIFTLSLYCYRNESCYRWVMVDNASDIPPTQYVPLERGVNCTGIRDGFFPRNPMGKITECVSATFYGMESGYITYFVLMADGKVKYWQHGNSLIEDIYLFFISTVVLPILVAVIISVVYLVRYIVRKSRKRAAD